MFTQSRFTRLLVPAVALASVMPLSACGPDRDALISEKVARAEAAARRAEKARDTAEKAAKAIQASAPTMVEALPEPVEDATEEAPESGG